MKLLHIISYFLIRVFGILPFRLSYSLGYLIGLLYGQFSKRDLSIATANIHHCFPEMTTKECQTMARKSLINTAINLMESVWVWQRRYPAISKKIIQIDNLELFENAKIDTIFTTPHFGQWEIFSDFLTHHCDNLTMLSKETGVKIFDDYTKRSRKRSGKSTILPCTHEGIIQLYTLIKQGNPTIILADQEPKPKYGIYSPFFGQQALSSLLIQDIVQKTGVKVVGISCQRLVKGRGFHISFFEVEENIYSTDIKVSTAALNRCYEKIIRQNPEQYTWSYKLFNTPPNGEQRIY